MAEDPVTLTVRAYDPQRGAGADVEGGDVTFTIEDEAIVIAGDSAGLRDLARWCLAIADENAPAGVHIHLDPGVTPLTGASTPILILRTA